MQKQYATTANAFHAKVLGSLLILGLIAGCAAPSGNAPAPQAERPAAAPTSAPRVAGPPVRTVTETFFGTRVTDDYRYFENVSDPEVVNFMKAESAKARGALDAIPGRAALEKRINELSQASVAINGVQVTGTTAAPRVFYYKLAPGVNSRKLYMREGFRGAERMVFDPQAVSASGQRFAIDYFLASPDGRTVVVGVAAGGSEDTSIRLIDVSGASARDTGLILPRIGFADDTKWAPDSKSFFYNQLPAAAQGATNRYMNSRAMRHVLGRSPQQDEVLFSRESAGVNLADIDIPSVEVTADGRTLVGRVEHGDARELSVFVADAGEVGRAINWRRVVEPRDEVTNYKIAGTSIYYLSKKDAPRYRVLRGALPGAAFASATTIVPQGDHVIAEIQIAQDALYMRELRNGGVDFLQRLNFQGNRMEFIRLPFDQAIRQLITSSSRGGAMVRLESFTEGPRYLNVEERSGNTSDTQLHPPATANFSDIVELRLFAPAKDGTKIPVSLVYRKSTQLNSFNPTLIRAYGAYGIVQTPGFNPSSLAWLERGGILATCHVRGGGEFGEAWHRAGQKSTKPNTWRDLIACGEYLVQRGFTQPSRMGIQGGSAGGITIGRAITERPDLFAAAVPAVGVLDALRMEFTPNGPPNIPEFGSVKTEEGFRGLLAMSTYHNVKDGTRYPAVMLVHGVNDPRVEVWHSAKMAARLMASNTNVSNPKPVLLRLDYDAGHGVGSTRNQRNAELADVYSFMLWQFNEPGFQPGR